MWRCFCTYHYVLVEVLWLLHLLEEMCSETWFRGGPRPACTKRPSSLSALARGNLLAASRPPANQLRPTVAGGVARR